MIELKDHLRLSYDGYSTNAQIHVFLRKRERFGMRASSGKRQHSRNSLDRNQGNDLANTR